MINRYYIKNVAWQSIKDFFSPKQKWLTKKIPKQWYDKCDLIPLLLFEILVHYVEVEEGLANLDFNWDEELSQGFISQEYVNNVNTANRELKDAYEYIKSRPALEQAHTDSYPEINMESFLAIKEPYEIAYGETNRLKKELEDGDQKAMQTIIKHWKILWT